MWLCSASGCPVAYRNRLSLTSEKSSLETAFGALPKSAADESGKPEERNSSLPQQVGRTSRARSSSIHSSKSSFTSDSSIEKTAACSETGEKNTENL